MGRLLLVCLLAACGSEHPAGVDALPSPDAWEGPPLQLDLDISVVQSSTAATVFVYAGGTDQTCGCTDEDDWHFPKIGTCEVYGDAAVCLGCGSCLRAELVGSGIDRQALPEYFGIQFFDLPATLPQDLVLRLSGCGHPTFDIPLQPVKPPVPTLDVQTNASDLVVRWTTDIPAGSSLVGGSSLWVAANKCHLDTNEHTFEGWADLYGQPHAYVGVTTFLPVLVQSTPAGEARIWRGASTYAPLQ